MNKEREKKKSGCMRFAGALTRGAPREREKKKRDAARGERFAGAPLSPPPLPGAPKVMRFGEIFKFYRLNLCRTSDLYDSSAAEQTY